MVIQLTNYPDDQIARTTCYRTRQSIQVDGHLDEDVWKKVIKSPSFVDMVTGETGFFNTQAATLWDDDNLYIAFWIEEPNVEAHLTQRDSIIFTENDVEVFIDGGDCYYELEINALGTIYEVFFIWQEAYKKGGRFDIPEFDLISRQALSFGGDFDRVPETFWWGTHPRKCRWAFLDWDLKGLQSAVQVEGKINDRKVVDHGWTVELALPWSGMGWLANGRSLPPKNGDEWRIFFGRFEKLAPSGIELNPHPAWVWSPHGIYDTHLPSRFPYVTFSETYIEDL